MPDLLHKFLLLVVALMGLPVVYIMFCRLMKVRSRFDNTIRTALSICGGFLMCIFALFIIVGFFATKSARRCATSHYFKPNPTLNHAQSLDRNR